MFGIEEYLLLMFLISIIAGLIGAMVGLGGGILVVPVLTLLFNVPIDYAIGASIVSVIATSSGSASAYVRDKITNIRVGMFLEIATTIGAVIGALTTLYLAKSGLEWIVFVAFGLVLLTSSYDLYRKSRLERKSTISQVNQTPNRIADRLNLKGKYYDGAMRQEYSYEATRVPQGFGVMFFAGLLSGLLGIGSGALKVLGMDTMMKLPFKVSTTTSNFMMGVTAAASTGIFYIGGFVNPIIAAPVAVGVMLGSFAGAKVLVRTRPASLRILFIFILIILGLEMLQKGLLVR
ncbi:MAG: sulfite exporter TauE/SafE family protein [Nitrososphaerota archaeon]|nr:sulfite exporter TauE/SafE family protein [Nitrososphaerota archaeon]